MMVIALLSWWYTTGWTEQLSRASRRAGRVLEQFSVGLLARSLFDPYRQISSGRVQGGLDVQLRAWGDRTFSRVFGAIVRSLLIVTGLISALCVGLVGWVQAILWPAVPLLPVAGLVVWLMGWAP